MLSTERRARAIEVMESAHYALNVDPDITPRVVELSRALAASISLFQDQEQRITELEQASATDNAVGYRS